MAPDPEEAELLALVAAAREAIRRTIVSSGVEPGIAAAACAELAGEYAAVLAARQDVPPSPVLAEVAVPRALFAATLRRIDRLRGRSALVEGRCGS